MPPQLVEVYRVCQAARARAVRKIGGYGGWLATAAKQPQFQRGGIDLPSALLAVCERLLNSHVWFSR